MTNTIVRLCSPTVVCPLCRGPTIGVGSTVCPECVDELRYEVRPYSSSIDIDDREVPCIVAAEYGGRAKRAIEVMKFAANRRVARVIGDLLLEPLLHRLLGDPIPPHIAIVPIPASVAGRWHRGFDQVAVISRDRGIPVECLLNRKRGVQQKTLDKDRRSANAVGQYGIRRNIETNRFHEYEVVLVDDVMTTGASVATCLRLLQRERIPVRGVAVCTAAT